MTLTHRPAPNAGRQAEQDSADAACEDRGRGRGRGRVPVGAVVLAGHPRRWHDPAAATAGRTQQTLALGVAPLHAGSVVSALLGTDPTKNTGAIAAAAVALLLVDAAGVGHSVLRPDVDAGQERASGGTDRTPWTSPWTGTWSLTPSGSGRLVDDVGGVEVAVNAQIIVRNPNGHSRCAALARAAEAPGRSGRGLRAVPGPARTGG